MFWNSAAQDMQRRDAAATMSGHVFKLRGATPGEMDMFARLADDFDAQIEEPQPGFLEHARTLVSKESVIEVMAA